MRKTDSSPDDTWTIARLLDWTQNYFKEKDIDTPRLDAELLLCKVLHCTRVSLYTNFDKPLTTDELASFRMYVKRRAALEPVAYITGEKSFFNLDLYVDDNVLIPRPDTERLIEVILDEFGQRRDESLSILDLGVGSGAIALTLASLFKNSSVTAIDISVESIKVARKNAVTNNIDDRVSFIVSNWFAALSEKKEFDIIVSNPPYIRKNAIDVLQPDVKFYEPLLALDGGDDGLDNYRIIMEQAGKYLNNDGLLFFEIGFDQGDGIKEICNYSSEFSLGSLVKDYGGRDRVAIISKN